ncbi:hypothetical protein JW921_01370 [Candidatus Fermentibacterales bacterium]|nr:hypothetical protein [Candidatus Fermentibacterales bacterium]
MSEDFEMQRRYFTSRLKQFSSRPDLHRAQIADCNRYLEMLDEAGSPEAFSEAIRRTGNMVSAARAEAHDRYRNREAVYRALGHERKAMEDRQRLEIIESAQTHADLASKLESFEETSRLAFDENKAMNALSSVIEALFHLCTDPPGSGAEERSLAKLRAYWEQLREADPDACWERIMTYPAYRDRLIFTDAQLGVLGEKHGELVHG